MGGTKLGGNSEKVERAGAAGTRTVFLAAIVLSVIAVFGVFVVFQFVDTERQRDLRAWQVRMGIVADSRLGAVEEWLERQRAQVRDLADNASLQLYMTELSLAAGDPALVTEEPAQRTYLRNLLTARAEVGGFTAPIRGPEIDANVSRQGVAGIAAETVKVLPRASKETMTGLVHATFVGNRNDHMRDRHHGRKTLSGGAFPQPGDAASAVSGRL